MLKRPRCQTVAGTPAQSGFTLAELILVLALGALVLGLVSSVGVHLERRMHNEAARRASNDQLEAATELLPLDLRALSPTAGDIAEARDSSLQYRATLGSALVCSADGTTLILAPYLAAGGRSIAPAAQVGDTLWLLTDIDSGASARPLRLDALRRISGSCPAVDASGATLFDLSHLLVATVRESLTVSAPSLVRMTRPFRFSFYRAADGRWYLGAHSWNSATSRFNPVQPLSGPYAPLERGTGSRFQYFDAAGRPIASTVGDTRAIARIEVLLVGEPPAPGTSALTDSQRLVVAPRNR